MTLSTITNATWPSVPQRGHPGPFQDSSTGYIYVVAQPSGSTGDIGVYRSNNGGSSWTELDSSNRPSTAQTVISLAADQLDGGSTLRIASITLSYTSGMGTLVDVEYHEFNMSTETWTTTNDVISQPDIGSAGPTYGIEICTISSSLIRVFYMGPAYTNMGTDYANLCHAYGTAGSWTADIALDNDVRYQASPSAIEGTASSCHIAYKDNSYTAFAKTIDSSHAQSTRITVNTTTVNNMGRLQTFDVSGTQKVVVLSSGVYARRLEEDGSGNVALESGQSSTQIQVASGSSPGSVYANGISYASYGWTDFDLYYNKSTAGLAANWGTGVELEDATTTQGSWLGFYSKTLGYLIVQTDFNGVLYYGALTAPSLILNKRKSLKAMVVR